MLKTQLRFFLISLAVALFFIFNFGGWGNEGSLFLLAALGAPLTFLVYLYRLFDEKYLSWSYLSVVCLFILQFQVVALLKGRLSRKQFMLFVSLPILLSICLMSYLLFH
jgi:undecaprenyl pyrophosphate phosphatase UppP